MPKNFHSILCHSALRAVHTPQHSVKSLMLYFTLHDEHLLLVVECGLSYVNVFSL